MPITGSHITVCICTFRRPVLLAKLLRAVEEQVMDGFTYSVVVADNDAAQSARSVVDAFGLNSSLPVKYCVEPVQNLALIRNRAVGEAHGEFLAFIDDDEIPEKDWLLRLLEAHRRLGGDGILGPVKPYFDTTPPDWVIRGRFFERPDPPTGYRLRWSECRTGNALIRSDILEDQQPPFRSQFTTAGEDMDFFRRMIDNGRAFFWCREAAVHELVPPERWRRSFLLKRALLRGSNFPKHPADRAKNILKSLIAVPTYAIALPILMFFGQHIFLRYLIKLFDHASRLLAFLGWSVVNERQT